ncbi:hypothetical protein I5495_07995 [Citrobacter amalonaticus]|uniref:hypothetical protein n=1 Tax=Citrobacter amalonaticus TaxID=35703 RepID=UPI0019087110|nr:hypothetical protein [Citrobacter amalonaticus]MBJ9257271.1 hypothetical protein [Citrobacter amalonaticus]
MDESRKQFAEVFEELTGWELEDYPNQDYADTCWEFWKKSRAAIEIELPPVCDSHSDDIDKGYDICHYRIQELLKKQSITFKIEGSERWSQISEHGIKVKE